MKNLMALAIFIGILAMSCTKEKPESTGPADYTETYNDLVQNKEDSVNQDTAAVTPPKTQDSASTSK